MAQVTDHTKPFIVDKNLGTALDIDNAQLTETTCRWDPCCRTDARTEIPL